MSVQQKERRRGQRRRGHVARATQLTLRLPATRGGKRRGAGRPRGPGRSRTPHRARPEHAARHPVHVTLRSSFKPLRNQFVYPTVCLALAGANRRAPDEFRILHFSVQHDHIHLVVEASDKRALSAGVRSVLIRVARSVNELVLRRGAFWADRWFGRALTSPRQVRNALVYVLANFRKHARSRLPAGVDPYSSAMEFDGWQRFAGSAERAPPTAGRVIHGVHQEELIVSSARCWLAARGWRRHGLVRIDEAPVG